MEETISLQEIFQTIKKRTAMILVITILAVIASGIVTKFFMTPKYDASTQILVNQKDQQTNQVDATAIQTNIQLINTYSVIIQSPAILNQVSKDLGIQVTPKELKINSEQNSQVLTITVETQNPKQSVDIANEIATVFKTKVQKIMKVDNVSVLSKADLASSQAPVKPNLKLNLVIALVVGLMISIALAFLLEYLDNTIKTEADIEKWLELPVLGSISNMEHGNKGKQQQRHPVNQPVRSGRFES